MVGLGYETSPPTGGEVKWKKGPNTNELEDIKIKNSSEENCKGQIIQTTTEKDTYIYICICYELTSLFSGVDKKFTFSSKDGAALYGDQYYKVESEDTTIEGCYKIINFHSVHPKASGHEYPIYKQTSGAPLYLHIDVTADYAPWLFTDKEGNIIYR